MKKPTTPKQRKFVRALIRTLCPTEAAWQAYDCKDRLVARNIGSMLVAKLGISMTELMDQMGLNEQKDIEDLKRLRGAKITRFFAHEGEVVSEKEVEDNATQLKALELSLKLKGHLKEHIEHSGSIAFIGMLGDKIKEARSRSAAQREACPGVQSPSLS